MSNKIWKAMWKRNDIAFHQPIINPLLRQYLPQLQLSAGDTILVPLCGKSLDMDLFADEGYRVIGIELSNVAIQAYFAARNVKPVREKRGRFIRWRYGDVEIWCGDVFDLSDDDLKGIKLLYDRASLTAFPAETRPRYVKHFYEKLSPQCQILLVTTETPDEQIDSSTTTVDAEVSDLYANYYHIDLLHGENSMQVDPEQPHLPCVAMEDKVYRLTYRQTLG